MINIIKKSFRILKNNMIFVQPLMLLLLIILAVLTYIIGVKTITASHYALSFSIFLLICAFLSGWFYINKDGVLNYSETDDKEAVTVKSVQSFKKFFEGVGAGFVNVFISMVFISVVYFVSFFFVYKSLKHSIGIPQFIYELPKLYNADSQQDVMQFLNSVADYDKLKFVLWIICINIVSIVLNFCSALYYTVLIFDEKNIFVTLLNSIKFFFKNIFSSLVIIIFAEFLYFCISILSAVLGSSIIAFMILIVLFTIYLNYYLLLIFCFYYEKSKINCDSRTERDGQNQAGC